MPSKTQRFLKTILHSYPFANGAGRLIDRSMLRHSAFRESEIEIESSDKFRMIVNPNDWIGRHLYFTGHFDRTILEVLISQSRPGDVLLDIGANIGYISCGFLNRVPNSRVISVEPQSSVFSLLKRNLAINGPGRSDAVRAAISNNRTKVCMSVPGHNSGAGKIVPLDNVNEGSVDAFEACLPRDILGPLEVSQVDLVKIDVEGHESEVFSALREEFERSRPRAIVFEHGGDLHSKSSLIGQILKEFDYRVFGIRKRLNGWSLSGVSGDSGRPTLAHDYLAMVDN